MLHVVRVFDDTMESGFPWKGEHPRTPYAPVRADVFEQLHRAVEQAGAASLAPAVLADEGRVHDTIVERAAGMDADLLVLGTHGRGGFQRLFLGSVTEKVIRTARCPVLTVPPVTSTSKTTSLEPKQIVCPVDFAPASLKALEYGLGLARQDNGCLTILHAVEYLDSEEPSEHEDAAVRVQRQHIAERARERVHHLAEQQDAPWCQIEERVMLGRAYRATLDYAAARNADLIVMGAQGRSGVELMLYGSNTHHVIQGATCPVLTVRASHHGKA